MKVLYDYQACLNQRFGGISRYFYELIQRFKNREDVDASLICLFNDNAYFTGESRPTRRIRGRKRINCLVTKLALKFMKYDIFHPTFYDTYFLPYYKGKFVLTVYDMINEKMPEYFPDDPSAEQKKILIHKADKIIAISKSTKKDILQFYPDIDEDKITVIYIASNFKPVNKSKCDNRFPARYILFVGNRGAYKNYANFFKSVSPILKEDDSLHLVCIGGGAFTQDELSNQSEFRNRIHQMNASDTTLSYAYSHAQCFVFPSLYEGFGIPTLEAFASDCPVILSNTSSMPEVGGDAAEYIDPSNIEDMTQKIRNVLGDEALRKSMIEKGRKQLQKFDWDDIAQKTLKVYEETLKTGRN